jgi:hypothetical protein
MEKDKFYKVTLLNDITEDDFLYKGMDFLIKGEALHVFLEFAFNNNYKAILEQVEEVRS